jgi:ribonuclease Z
VESYEESMTLEVLEWGEPEARLWSFRCRERFRRVDSGAFLLPESEHGIREVHREVAFRVTAAALDHQVPSLGFALEEPVHVNVWRDALDRLGLSPGPWVRLLKDAVLGGDPADTPISLPTGETAALGALLDAGAATRTEGQKLAYVADCLWAEPSLGRAVALARGAHILYCEAAFLEEDSARARDRYHLTAAQAGELARAAEVGELRIFHFSPKYRGREEELRSEAAEAFGRAVGIG